MKNFEDYSFKLKQLSSKTITGKLFCFEDCKNNNLISEDSLVRTINFVKTKTFAIISAYRAHFSKQENIQRNRKLRDIFNKKKMGVHQLVGHWTEAPQNKDDIAKHTIERSYLVVKPENMTNRVFTELIVSCLTINNETQDSALIHYVIDETNKENQDDKFYVINDSNELTYIGKELKLNKIAQAYSQHIKKINIPFVFEGLEIPGSNSGRLMFSQSNILY